MAEAIPQVTAKFENYKPTPPEPTRRPPGYVRAYVERYVTSAAKSAGRRPHVVALRERLAPASVRQKAGPGAGGF